jgi:hypothetical protein
MDGAMTITRQMGATEPLVIASEALTDMPETFETFLRIWIAENIDPLGSQIDATNLKYILRVKADELEKAATSKGFYGELAEAVRPYGGIEGYVQHQFEEASPGTKRSSE